MSNELAPQGDLIIPQLGQPPAVSKREAKRQAAKERAEKAAADEKFAKGIEAVKAEPMEPVKEEVEDDPLPPTVDQTLVRILQWKRPHDSAGEKNFCIWLIEEIKARGGEASVGPAGCLIAVIPHPPSVENKSGMTSSTLFSCHTDTVHSECYGEQRVMYDTNFGHLFLDSGKEGNAGSCLGADDGAGIWLMLEMLKARVPGTYIFHRGEERGGIGSREMLRTRLPFLELHELAIAFDRKGQCDVITHQGGQRCASDKAGTAIAERLNGLIPGAKYSLCDGGSFTDTKVYEGCIDECFNLSVGYENAHGKDEQLDYGFLLKLRNAVVALAWDAIPIERDCKAKPIYKGGQSYGGWENWQQNHQNKYTQSGGSWKKNNKYVDPLPNDEDAAITSLFPKGKKKQAIVDIKTSLEPRILDELDTMDQDEIYSLVEDQEIAYRVILALYVELKGAATKIETLQNLITP